MLIALAVVTGMGLILAGNIPQDDDYHLFADSRVVAGIPNFWNVVSNLPFLAVGMFGLLIPGTFHKDKRSYLVLYLGIILVAIGSAYYHLDSNNSTLVWDRLPMTVAFMSLCSIVIEEFIAQKPGRTSLIPMILAGILSVVYWISTGDLRLYVFIQFYPMLAIPVIVITFRSGGRDTRPYWTLLVLYGVAKVFEHFDPQTYELLGFISGHSLKHIAAATGLFVLVNSYRNNALVKG